MLDDLNIDAGRLGRFPNVVARVALVGPRHFDRFARGLLHRVAQLFDLRALLFIGGRDGQRNELPQRITALCTLPLGRRL